MFVMTHLSRVTNMRAGNELVGTQMSAADTKHTQDIGLMVTHLGDKASEIEIAKMMTLCDQG